MSSKLMRLYMERIPRNNKHDLNYGQNSDFWDKLCISFYEIKGGGIRSPSFIYFCVIFKDTKTLQYKNITNSFR